MTEKDLFREIGNINEKYVTEAEETKRSVILTPTFRRMLATAACLVVCFGLYFGVRQLDLGVRNESATMQTESNTSAGGSGSNQMMENVVMDSASEGTSTATGDAADMEDGAFWGDLWPFESETAADCTPLEPALKQESTSVDGVVEETAGITNAEAEKAEENGEAKEDYVVQGTLQDSVPTFAADLYYDESVWMGQKDLDAFLDKVANGEAAVLELIHLFEDGTYAYASIYYTDEACYEWTEWHAPSYGQDVEAPVKTVYGYLNVFADTAEDGTVYYVLGLGETEDFTLQDLQDGISGTCFVLKYEKK